MDGDITTYIYWIDVNKNGWVYYVGMMCILLVLYILWPVPCKKRRPPIPPVPVVPPHPKPPIPVVPPHPKPPIPVDPVKSQPGPPVDVSWKYSSV